MGQRCRPQSFGEVQRCNPLCFSLTAAQYCCCSWAPLTDQLVRKFKDRLGFNTTMKKFVIFVPVQTMNKYLAFPTRAAVQASCDKHTTEWRLPRWCPQRRSPLMPSRTDSSKSYVILRWSALSWGSAVGLKVSARCSDAIRCVSC